MEIKELSVKDLKELQDNKEDFLLIDVRKPEEFQFCNLNGKLIPLQAIPDNVDQIAKDKKVIVHCHHGGRSKKAIAWLQENHGFDNLYNLAGGIHEWSLQIDNSVPVY